MSLVYVPKRPKKVVHTVWSTSDNSFDVNTDGAAWLGRVHEYLELPIAEKWDRKSPPRVPWLATAAQCKAWAQRLTVAFEVFRIEHGFLLAWRDFLASCGGYDVLQ
jgi:hypothetical protein